MNHGESGEFENLIPQLRDENGALRVRLSFVASLRAVNRALHCKEVHLSGKAVSQKDAKMYLQKEIYRFSHCLKTSNINFVLVTA
jgi:hypothetical protein